MTEERRARIIQAIIATQPDELSCEDLTEERRSLYVESALAGEDPGEKYPLVAQHLLHCPDCAEELADLRHMLEMAQEDLPQPDQEPVFDLSFLRGERFSSARDAARDVVERFFAEEISIFNLVSERFFSELEKLRERQAAPPRPGLLDSLFSRRPVASFAMALNELKLTEGETTPMALKVLVAAVRMEDLLAKRQLSHAEAQALPESIRRELIDIGREVGLPHQTTKVLIERFSKGNVEG